MKWPIINSIDANIIESYVILEIIVFTVLFNNKKNFINKTNEILKRIEVKIIKNESEIIKKMWNKNKKAIYFCNCKFLTFLILFKK